MTSCLQRRSVLPIRCSAWFALVLAATLLAAAPGDEHWDDQFGWPGTTNSVQALAVNGNRVYAGGSFLGTSGPATNNFVEVWDGTRWSYIPGLEGGVMILFDFAFLGGELYVAGQFTRAGTNRAVGLARWNGNRWSDVGGFEGTVRTIVSDGSKMYVGGAFTNAGGVHVTNVACWNGSQWFEVGGGLGLFSQFQQSAVVVLHLHQGDLYAGGAFTNSGAAPVRNVARWNGSTWVEVGGGANATVYALASEGSSLYAGGDFTIIGTTAANRIARWQGTNWSPLFSGADGTVSAIGVLDGRVYIGGAFSRVGGVSASRFAVWNGSSWSATGSGLDGTVTRMKVAGTNLYVGGGFFQADDILVNHVGVWNGTNWSGLGQAGRANGIGGTSVRAIASAGNDIYVGGSFTGAGKIRPNRIARFDGVNWHPLGSGIRGGVDNILNPPGVNAIAISGTNLFAGGVFTNAGGVTVSNIARWDGNAWSGLSSGIPGTVSAIAVRGNDVFVGGDFFMFTPGGGAAFSIARWNGIAWSSLRGSIGGTSIRVNALAVQGSNIILGGSFAAASPLGVLSTNVVMSDGNDFVPMNGGVNGIVNAIAVLGTNVYVGGDFSRAGGVAASRIARWNGSSWSALGSGIQGSGAPSVSGLTVVGTNLYVSGNFTNAGGVIVNRVAQWNGSAWSALGSGLTRSFGGFGPSITINVLLGRGNDLFAGGSIEYAGGKPSFLLARWNDQIDFDVEPAIQLGKFLAGSAGPFKMTVTASGMPSYVIEATTNFSSWTALMTNSASPFEFSDFTAPSRPHRFYRARQGP